MASEAFVLSSADQELLDRLATRVVELRMEVPAILALESGRPLSLVAGQAMLFFEPLVQSLFRLPDYRRYAALIERREACDHLLRRIEDRAEAARASRKASARGGPAPRAPSGRA
jgi:hypothetical protein